MHPGKEIVKSIYKINASLTAITSPDVTEQ